MSMCNPLGYDRPAPVLYVHVPAWLEAPYSITVSALSRRSLFVAFGFPS